MLSDFDPDGWQVKHLPPLVTRTGNCAQGGLTVRTDGHTVRLDMIWLRHGAQGVTGMPCLGAYLLATG